MGDLGGSGYVALLTIDPVTNKVTISDYSTGIPIYGLPDGLPTTDPGYTAAWSGSDQCNNTYDPATKTFYLRMGYFAQPDGGFLKKSLQDSKQVWLFLKPLQILRRFSFV